MNIIICCDFLMTRTQTQKHHLNWFDIIVSRAISNASNIKSSSFISDINGEGTFSRKKFFSLSKVNLDEETTHFYFSSDDITDESISYLKTFIDGSLIIGYEMSEQTREVLKRVGCDYIDIWLHPIRFLDDNFFAFTSSNDLVMKKMINHEIKEDVFYLYADKLKIQSFMGWDKFKKRVDDVIEPNSCLFVGQTLTDKAVCREGKMLTILDFKDDFEELTKRYNHVYYSPHPMLRGDDGELRKYLNAFHNVTITDIPGYQLLCSEHIDMVASISSSLVYESVFFGKKSKFLYRPIVPIHASLDVYPCKYISIYNKLHSKKFWADILSPLVDVSPVVEDADFLTSSDNYRDMLSLYYNNSVFDKHHFSYEKVTSKKNVAINRTKIINSSNKPVAFFSNSVFLEKIKKIILDVDVVSFDVFDTLVQRNVSKPGDIIRLVGDFAERKFGIDKETFVKCRYDAKKYSKYKNETPLKNRYEILSKRMIIDSKVARELYEYELSCELSLISHRKVGLELLSLCRSLKKRVVLISDTYFDIDFINEIIKKCGLGHVDNIYVSSDYDQTKESGGLFNIVREKEKGKIHHIGDNVVADYFNAVKHGFTASHLLSNLEQARKCIVEYRELDGLYASIRNGLIQAKITNYPIISKDAGYTRGSTFNLGYNVVGDIFLGFSHWILHKAKADGVKKIVFLARDGDIVKKCVDIINVGNTVETVYLLASRRSLRVISLESREAVLVEIKDLCNSFNQHSSRDVIEKFISMRFGLSIDKIKELDVNGVLAQSDIDSNELKNFLQSETFILETLNNAFQERHCYLEYLKSKGISNTNDIAFVDIGHHGSLQASLAKVIGLSRTHGYYFSTYSGIDDKMKSIPGLHYTSGYYRDRVDVSNRSDLYIRYALMIESLFLNTKGSFIKINVADTGELEPVYLDTSNEDKRLKFAHNLQLGVVAYMKDFKCAMDAINMKSYSFYDLSKSYDPCERFFRIMKKPSMRDVHTFSGVVIENYFSGRDIRYLAPPLDELDAVSIWSEGKRLMMSAKLEGSGSGSNNGERRLNLRRISDKLIWLCRPFISKGKFNKFETNRDLFYRDSKFSFLRNI